MFTSAAKRYAIDPAVESITCKISLIYLNDHLDVDMKVPSCNAKMEVFFQPKRRKKPIAFNPCFPLKIYPLVFVGIHYLVSMNNVRRITFGTLRKRDFLRFFFFFFFSIRFPLYISSSAPSTYRNFSIQQTTCSFESQFSFEIPLKKFFGGFQNQWKSTEFKIRIIQTICCGCARPM